jgi:hypothetical protein
MGPADTSSLLGLEPPAVEKAGQNPAQEIDADGQPRRAPLLGTSTSQGIENARGSSERRSPESVCYTELLREDGLSSGKKSRKTVVPEGFDCHGLGANLFARRCVSRM